jgi:hypothetical protein
VTSYHGRVAHFVSVWNNFLTTFLTTLTIFLTTFWQFIEHFLTTFWQLFDRFLTTFWQYLLPIFFIFVVVASCGNKYYGSNFIFAVPTLLLIAPGLRTIQFLFNMQKIGDFYFNEIIFSFDRALKPVYAYVSDSLLSIWLVRNFFLRVPRVFENWETGFSVLRVGCMIYLECFYLESQNVLT